MPFTFHPTAIADVVLIESRLFHDERGYFREGFKSSDFADAGLPTSFAQDNVSRSGRGVLRGLHFQRDPAAQGKLVSVARGSVFDVAVDIRVGSPTYGRWVGEELSDENGRMLWIPTGFAHGFCVTTEFADLTYKCTDEFSGAHDGGVLWNDPAIAIDWPVVDPILSEKDLVLPLLADCDHGFVFEA
jgi:dTDP-4-dehydrorhamnose 3,5-epimerase